MITNEERAKRLDDILPFYPEEQHTNLIDLLADAMHWCRLNDVNFHEVLRIAEMHFAAEANETV